MTRFIYASLLGFLFVSLLRGATKEEPEKKVAIGVQYVAIPEATLEKYNLINLKEKSPTGHTLSSKQQEALFSAIEKENGIVVKRFSRVSLKNEQSVTLDHTQEVFFVTEVEVKVINEETIYQPKNLPTILGTEFTITPNLNDKSDLSVKIAFRLHELESSEIPLVPISSKIRPTNSEGVEDGREIPFTQFLQQPKFQSIQTEGTLPIPRSGYATLFLGTKIRETRNEFGPPVLSKIPYVNRLYKNVGVGRGTEFIFAVLKAEVVDPSKSLRSLKPTMIRGAKPDK